MYHAISHTKDDHFSGNGRIYECTEPYVFGNSVMVDVLDDENKLIKVDITDKDFTFIFDNANHHKFVVFVSIDNPRRWGQWHSGETDSVYYSPFFSTQDEVNAFLEQLKKDYPNSNLLDPQARDYYIKYTTLTYDETREEDFKTLCRFMRAYRPYSERR